MGKTSIPGAAIAILEIVTIDIPCTAADVELKPTLSPLSVVNGIPIMFNGRSFTAFNLNTNINHRLKYSQ